VTEPIDFDSFADDYDHQLGHGLSATGEDKNYFANGRIELLSKRLAQLGASVETILDFGCGTGTAAPLFFDHLGCTGYVGVDESARSIEVAKYSTSGLITEFQTLESFTPSADVDVAYANGVFHHIVPADRVATASLVYSALKPGGHFALWDNNPWNPGTRYVMKKIPFDRDAIRLSAPEARHVLRDAGFEIIATDFLFIFPAALSALRFMERPLSKLPIGGQYQVLARKPEA
jgi:SAM-dependent methyltransferase